MYRQHRKAVLAFMRATQRWKTAVLGCFLAAGTSVALACMCGGGHCTCPGSSMSKQVGAIPGVDTWVALSSAPLLPGATQPTFGTNLADSPGLMGKVITSKTFSFETSGGNVKGSVTLSAINADKGSCAM
jgi:hypothetical protein